MPDCLSRGDRYAVRPIALMAFATGVSKLQGHSLRSDKASRRLVGYSSAVEGSDTAGQQRARDPHSVEDARKDFRSEE